MDFTCRKCGKKFFLENIEICPDCQKELNEFCRSIYKKQPLKNREIDQFSMTIESILSQTAYISESFKGNTSAFFGGYDGVGLLSTFFNEEKIVLLDIDKRVLDWWKGIGDECGFEVITYEYNAHKPLPKEIIQSVNDNIIDCWRTDPPFNCAGMLCFFNRILHLDKNQAPIYLTIPSGTKWAQLLKHQIFELIKSNKIIGVSQDIYKYLAPDAPDSFIYKIEANSPIISNSSFNYSIKRPTRKFANSPYGCGQYDRCKNWRAAWDKEIKKEI